MHSLLAVPALVAIATFAQAPAGWDDTDLRGRQLMVAGKTAEAIALFERAVSRTPNFEDARYALADAHRMRGLELAVENPSQPEASRRHMELAATHFRWVAERGTPYRQVAAGHLMELYEDDLNQPREAIGSPDCTWSSVPHRPWDTRN